MIYSKYFFGTEGFSLAEPIRRSVFNCGIDSLDEKSIHLIIYNDSVAVAAGRLYFDNGSYRMSKIGVLENFRGQGIGDMLTRLLIVKIFNQAADKITIECSNDTVNFFTRYGFAPEGNSLTLCVTPQTLVFSSKCGHDCSSCMACGNH